MYSISAQVYGEAARLVRQKSAGESYVSGVIEFAADGIDCILRLSAIIYREAGAKPTSKAEKATVSEEGESPDVQASEAPAEADPIRDIVAVWWEFHTYASGREIANDFSFGELRALLKAPNA